MLRTHAIWLSPSLYPYPYPYPEPLTPMQALPLLEKHTSHLEPPPAAQLRIDWRFARGTAAELPAAHDRFTNPTPTPTLPLPLPLPLPLTLTLTLTLPLPLPLTLFPLPLPLPLSRQAYLPITCSAESRDGVRDEVRDGVRDGVGGGSCGGSGKGGERPATLSSS
jgi:hypothetical protein